MADWGAAPRVLIFSDTEAGLAASSETALENGARILAALPIADALGRLDSQIAIDLIVLDVIFDHGPLLDQLLRTIEEAASQRRFGSVVVVAPNLLDIVSAHIDHEDVNLVVGREPQALALAMRERLSRTAPQLREDSRQDGRRSCNFNDDISRIGRTLAAAASYDEGEADAPGDTPAMPPSLDDIQPARAAAIREVIRARRLREELFGPGLFADPAWDILLDLTAARIEGRSVAVSSLCIAAAVPPTTALRWIKQLTEGGMLRRVADPVDGRRVFIELTEHAAAAMMAYFSAISRGACG